MNKAYIGVICLFLFIFGQAIRDVSLGNLFGTLGIFEVALLAFGTATVIFLVILLTVVPDQIVVLKRNPGLVSAVNITTTAAWLCYFGALKILEPSVANLIFSGIAPISVLVLSRIGIFSSAGARASALERFFHYGIIAALMFLVWVVVTGRSGNTELAVLEALTGMGLAALSGFIITAETVYAKQMNEAGISASGIVAVRFILITLVAGLITFSGENSITSMPVTEILTFCGVFAGIIALPNFIAQIGLKLTSPLTTGIITAFGPALVFVIQVFDGNTPASIFIMASMVLYTLFTLLSVASRTWHLSKQNEDNVSGIKGKPAPADLAH